MPWKYVNAIITVALIFNILVLVPPLVSSGDWFYFGVGLASLFSSIALIFLYCAPSLKKWINKCKN